MTANHPFSSKLRYRKQHFFYLYFRTLKKFKENWINILNDYETSPERLKGNGGVFDLILDFTKSANERDALTIDEVAETMIEIIFANQGLDHVLITIE